MKRKRRLLRARAGNLYWASVSGSENLSAQFPTEQVTFP